MDPILSVRNLTIAYRSPRGMALAVREVSMDLYAGETLALTGESGSGKTTLALAMLRLLPPAATMVGGQILYHHGREVDDVPSLTPAALQQFRGEQVAMVFQSALSALNPVLRIWDHFWDTARAHGFSDPKTVRQAALQLLYRVQLEPERIIQTFPHELSGGMRQRVMLALALLLRPRVVILDEPTTALDILTQRTIIDLLRSLWREFGFSMLFISHDLSLAAELADRVATMYAGRIVELGEVDAIFYQSSHPYTVGLLEAVPTIHGDQRTLHSIPGSAPDLVHLPPGCKFAPRCAYAQPGCLTAEPELFAVKGTHGSACFLWEQVREAHSKELT